jgi:acyl-CoA oxidase
VIGIIDALAPPDEVLGAPFGRSDGDIYNSYLK